MAKTIAFGTTLKWNTVSIAGLTAINGVDITVDMVDVTSHLSSNAYKEYLPSLIDAGEISVEGFFDYTDTTGQHAMLTDLNAKTVREWIITFPSATGATWTGNGYMTGFTTGAPYDGAIPFSAKIKPTGKPTFAVSTVTGMSAVGFSNYVLIMPTFAIGTYEYVVTITNGQTSTVITPVDASDGEIITIVTDGAGSQVVATGEASSACTLDVDDVTEIVITISHATKASKVYTFHCAVLAA
jgi:predicted secreted protein